MVLSSNSTSEADHEKEDGLDLSSDEGSKVSNTELGTKDDNKLAANIGLGIKDDIRLDAQR